MKFFIVACFVLISSVLSAPQGDHLSDDDFDQQDFQQQGSPFQQAAPFQQAPQQSPPFQQQQNSFGQSSQSNQNNAGIHVVRYFFENNGIDGYQFTLVSSVT